MSQMQEQNKGWLEKWPAPAKLNLMLRVTGRREDGYHLLQTVFQIIDLCDWLQFYPLDEDKVCLRRPLPGVDEQDELTVRAARLLKQYTGCSAGVSIDIDKRLPMGGGLGGGSSDAATTLVALNHLWKLGLTQAELMELGLQLGADVPVFVFGNSAWGEGVGEQLQAVTLPEPWIVVLKPDCHINTKQIFCSPGLTRDSKSITMSDFLDGDRKNDCEAVVLSMYPLVESAMEALSRFSPAKLTGTGACVYALFNEKADAEAACINLQKDWVVYLTKGLNMSPLYEKIQNGC